MMTSKSILRRSARLMRPRFGLAGELLTFDGSAIEYPDFSAALFEAEDRGPGRAPSAEHKSFRALDSESLLQRTNHAGNIGIETVEFAFLPADDGIARADLGRVRVGVIEVAARWPACRAW